MNRNSKKRFLRGRMCTVVALSLVAAALSPAANVVSAAPGDVATTTISVPSELAGLTGAAVTSARDGGMYYAYVSGSDYKMFKTKPDGTQDTAFGSSGIATFGAVQTTLTGTKRLAIYSALNGRWWTTNIASGTTALVPHSDIRIVGGAKTGAPDTDWVIPAATATAHCAAAYPSVPAAAWRIQSPRVLVRRAGGLWLLLTCSPTDSSGTPIPSENLLAIVAYSDAGTHNSAVAAIGLHNALGSAGPCYSVNTVADPTAPTGSPEIYGVRTEHNAYRSGSLCSANTATYTAAQISGYSIISVASDGSTTTTALASAGDSSDGSLVSRIDPGGRLVLVNSNLADPSKLTIRRLKTDLALDTSIGSSGITTIDLGAAPSGQAIVRPSNVGVITTASKVYFAILLSDATKATGNCVSTTAHEWGWRYAIVSPSDGLLSTWGTSGMGGRTTVSGPENLQCTSTVSGGGSVDNDGRPRIVRFDGSTTKLDIWAAPSGANGGGDGGTGSGGATTDTGGAASVGDGLSTITTTTTTTTIAATTTTVAKNPYDGATAGVTVVDSSVYPVLPKSVAKLSSVNVLTSAQNKVMDVQTKTPAICVPNDDELVFIDEGKCIAEVVNAKTRAVLRTLKTTVVADDISEVKVGNEIVTLAPIYFDVMSTKLDAKAMGRLRSLKARISAAGSVLLIGHSGTLNGNSPANVAVSKARAESTLAALKSIRAKGPFAIAGVGALDPASKGKTEADQAKNRRVVIVLIP